MKRLVQTLLILTLLPVVLNMVCRPGRSCMRPQFLGARRCIELCLSIILASGLVVRVSMPNVAFSICIDRPLAPIMKGRVLLRVMLKQVLLLTCMTCLLDFVLIVHRSLALLRTYIRALLLRCRVVTLLSLPRQAWNSLLFGALTSVNYVVAMVMVIIVIVVVVNV